MFGEIPVHVEAFPNGVTFRFGSAVSLITLVVSRGDDTLWELVADEMKPVEIGESFMTAVPLEEAPPHMLDLLRMAEANAEQRLQKEGPFKTPVDAVRYGVSPPGSSAAARARSLPRDHVFRAGPELGLLRCARRLTSGFSALALRARR